MIILLRHGQTAVNAGGRFQGRLDAPLTDLGRRQAVAAAAAIRVAHPPARVISSPLVRARDTAAAFGLDVEIDERWIELDYGEWDGRVLASVTAAEWDRWRGDDTFTPPGGESLVHLGRRVAEACADIAESAVREDVVVVSHVSPIKSAVAWALGVGPATSWRSYLGVAAVCRIAITERGPALHSFNEVAHLAGIASEA